MRLLTLVCVVSCIGGGWAKSKMAKREKEKNSKEFLVKAKSKKPSCSVDLKDLFSFDPCGLFDNNHDGSMSMPPARAPSISAPNARPPSTPTTTGGGGGGDRPSRKPSAGNGLPSAPTPGKPSGGGPSVGQPSRPAPNRPGTKTPQPRPSAPSPTNNGGSPSVPSPTNNGGSPTSPSAPSPTSPAAPTPNGGGPSPSVSVPTPSVGSPTEETSNNTPSPTSVGAGRETPSTGSGPAQVPSSPAVSTPTIAGGGGNPSQPQSPSTGSCLAIEGVYGSLDGTPVKVSFGYELETTPIKDGVLTGEVLPALENAFTEFLIPILFTNRCSESRHLRVELQVRRRLVFSGISARPDDLPIMDLRCTKLDAQGNDCSVILGELTLFLEDRRLSDEDDVRDSLAEGMENDSFLDADSRIVRVSYVDLDILDTGVDYGQQPIQAEPRSVNALLVGFVIAAAGTILLGGLVAYRRRRQRQFAGISITSIACDPPSDTERGTGDPSPTSSNENKATDDSEADPSESSVYLENETSTPASKPAAKPSGSLLDDSSPIDQAVSPSDSSIYLSETGSLTSPQAQQAPNHRFL